MATSPGRARMTSTWLPELLVTSQSYLRDAFLNLKINSPWSHSSLWLALAMHSTEAGSGACRCTVSRKEDRTLNGGAGGRKREGDPQGTKQL